MRSRHVARLCRDCHAPLASAADACWRCGVQWAVERQPATTLRLVAGHASNDQSRSDVERWTNEGGTLCSDVALPRLAAARR